MKVYLSGSFAHAAEIRDHARWLDGSVHRCTSSWLYEPPIKYDDPAHEEWQRRARANEDTLDVERSDVVIIFSEWPSTSGGLFVELGIALAHRKRIIVVGPRLNIFFSWGDIEYAEDFVNAVAMLADGR